MRKLSAHYVLTDDGRFVKYGILSLDDKGTVIDVRDPKGEMNEEEGLEFYGGILVPGFINAHCHLELSDLKGVLPQNKELSGFLDALFDVQSTSSQHISTLAERVDRSMYLQGIVAVGDTCNTTETISIKNKSLIRYLNFAEAFGIHPARADKSLMQAQSVCTAFFDGNQPCNLTPHSAYAVSDELFRKLIDSPADLQRRYSIHHLESKEENEFLLYRKGRLSDHYSSKLGIRLNELPFNPESATSRILRYIPESNPLLLVHNTVLEDADLDLIKESRLTTNTFFVVCPSSNQYITGLTPDYKKLKDSGFPICIGTDSLASNNKLSILAEIRQIQDAEPSILLEDLFMWATKNGAAALGMDEHLGSFTPGKVSGVNLITNINFREMKLTSASVVQPMHV
ncbi:MAG: amidohydrolase family protein [Bacteroidota bacterium]|nr:amidohydrolase family protein [Bacteroidota bacterium]